MLIAKIINDWESRKANPKAQSLKPKAEKLPFSFTIKIT
jgi:hypothetical protein